MGNISQHIDDIIAVRKQRAGVVEEARQNCTEVLNAVRAFSEVQANFRKNPNMESGLPGGMEIIERIAGIPTDEFYRLHNQYSAELDRLTKRLNRDSLHISFIGRAGQGKSLVMQGISGLSGNVIPSAEGSDCTGAKSIITNSDSDEVRAEITFFSEMEMVEIVNLYLSQITHSSQSVSSIAGIRTLNIGQLEGSLLYDNVKEKALLDVLRRYVEHIDEFADDLGKTRQIPEAEIEQYVAQYRHDDTSVKYYKYLGVKLANIYCRFPHEDAGRIVLVDTIGIGATSLGTEEKMKEAVANDSDAILFMFRPDSLRPRISDNEIDIVRMISEEVTPEYAKEMLFWVVNRVTSGNAENQRYVPEIVSDIRKTGYPVADVLDVDCKSAEEVKAKLLIPVLSRLSQRIQIADERLIDNLNAIGERLYAAYNRICQATDQAFASSANASLKRKFARRIENTFRVKLLGNLRQLYMTKYRELRSQPCGPLLDASKEQLRNVIRSVPSKEEILEMLRHGDINQTNAYEMCTDRMRMRIIDDFTSLNLVLERVIEEMKREVLRIFTDDDMGKLGAVYPLNDCDSSKWIHGLLELVDAESHYPLLADALNRFNEYTINVQGFLIHEVRDQLDALDISLSHMPPLTAQVYQENDVAEEITANLQMRASDTRNGIQTALEDLYKVPNRSMFAAIKDLYDRLTYAVSSDLESDSVLTQWRYLYEDWMHLIWREDYQKENAIREFAEQWYETSDKLKSMNRPDKFMITRK